MSKKFCCRCRKQTDSVRSTKGENGAPICRCASAPFIVLEGGDGSGKTTIINYLKTLLPEVIFTREPGGTVIADEIRAVLLERRALNQEQIDTETEILLFESSRAQHLINVIRPALSRGQMVITDRFDSSTFAYEIVGNERPDLLDFFEQVNSLVVSQTVPDFYIYLDIAPKMGAERRRRRNGEEDDTSYDAKTLDYHERVRDGYFVFFEKYFPDRYLVIDASQSLEKVQKEVVDAIRRCQKKRRSF